MNGEFPEGWAQVQLSRLVSFALGGDWGKDPGQMTKGLARVRVIRGTDFRTWPRTRAVGAAERCIKVSSLEKRKLQNGDLVLEVSGGGPDQPVGRTVLIDDDALTRTDLPLVCSNFFRQLRLDPLIDPSFVSHFLEYAYKQGAFNEFQTQTTNLRNLNVNDFLGSTEVHLAPRPEQKRIVAKLEVLLARVEACQQRLAKIPALLKRFRQSVLDGACSGRLTEDWRSAHQVNRERSEGLPEKWRLLQLKAVADVIDPNPSHRYPSYKNGSVPILATEQMCGLNDWDVSTSKLVDPAFHSERSAAHGFRADDIIFARKGRLGMARRPPQLPRFVFSHTIFIIRARGDTLSEYLLWFLRKDSCVSWLLQEMNSNTGVPTLGKAYMERLRIFWPPLQEQQEIVRRVEKLFALADQIEARFTEAKKRVNSITQSILAKAFSGQLVPTEYELAKAEGRSFESAEELLKRIKGDRRQETDGKRRVERAKKRGLRYRD